MIRLHAIFSGVVQGVFFRVTIRDHAERLGISGTAQNLVDGTVELYATGTREELDQLLAAIQSNPGSATIESVTTTFEPTNAPLQGFHIRY